MFRHRRRAFTLIELLVVIAIIAILVTLLLPVIALARCRARAAADKSTIKNLDAALTAFNADFGVFPADEDAPAAGPSNITLRIRGVAGDFFSTGVNRGAPNPTATGGRLRFRHLCPPNTLAGAPKVRLYYDLKDTDVDPATGVLLTNLGNKFYYQEWASRAVKGATAKKPFSYDIWSYDCINTPPTGTSTTADAMNIKNAPNETSVNNWSQ